MLKLIDLERLDDPEEVEVGTCDLCMSVEECYEPTLIFIDSKENTIEVEAYRVEKDSIGEIEIENIIDFADFIAKKQLPDDYFANKNSRDRYIALNNLISEYYSPKCI